MAWSRERVCRTFLTCTVPCPLCGPYGLLLFRFSPHVGKLFVECVECEEAFWEVPELGMGFESDDDAPGGVPATREAVLARGWGPWIGTEIGRWVYVELPDDHPDARPPEQ